MRPHWLSSTGSCLSDVKRGKTPLFALAASCCVVFASQRLLPPFFLCIMLFFLLRMLCPSICHQVLLLGDYFIISRRFTHLFKWASSGQNFLWIVWLKTRPGSLAMCWQQAGVGLVWLISLRHPWNASSAIRINTWNAAEEEISLCLAYLWGKNAFFISVLMIFSTHVVVLINLLFCCSHFFFQHFLLSFTLINKMWRENCKT